MQAFWRWWVRRKKFRGHVMIVLAFLVFTLHVITQRKASQGGTGVGAMRSLWIYREDPQRLPFPPSPPSLDSLLPGPMKPFEDWLEVAGSQRDFFLYSAFLDSRGSSRRVIIVAIIRKRKKVMGCRLWAGNMSRGTTATTKFIRENWNLAYSAALVMCTVSSDSRPTHASLLEYPATIVPVQDMSARVPEGRMSICVKPIHYEYDRALWLVEFIEFYRLLGADHFIFYNHTMGPRVQAVVEHYMARGVVKLLPWTLPVVTQKEIRTEGLFAALNDCNLRSVGRFPFAAMVDFDEFLVPRRHDSLLDLLASYGNKDSVYVFQNVFFYLYWDNDTAVYERLTKEPSMDVRKGLAVPYLLTAFKTRRLDTPHKYGVRSKYIVRPERVLELGNHHVWEYVGNKKERKVPPTDGLSHHYRICEYGGYDCLKQESHVDRTTHAWLSRLYSRVIDHCAEIFLEEKSCPIVSPLGSPY